MWSYAISNTLNYFLKMKYIYTIEISYGMCSAEKYTFKIYRLFFFFFLQEQIKKMLIWNECYFINIYNICQKWANMHEQTLQFALLWLSHHCNEIHSPLWSVLIIAIIIAKGITETIFKIFKQVLSSIKSWKV